MKEETIAHLKAMRANPNGRSPDEIVALIDALFELAEVKEAKKAKAGK